MEFAVMTLIFWFLMFGMVMVTMWVIKEVLYIICLMDSAKNENDKGAEEILSMDYPKLIFILRHVGYFDI